MSSICEEKFTLGVGRKITTLGLKPVLARLDCKRCIFEIKIFPSLSSLINRLQTKNNEDPQGPKNACSGHPLRLPQLRHETHEHGGKDLPQLAFNQAVVVRTPLLWLLIFEERQHQCLPRKRRGARLRHSRIPPRSEPGVFRSGRRRRRSSGPDGRAASASTTTGSGIFASIGTLYSTIPLAGATAAARYPLDPFCGLLPWWCATFRRRPTCAAALHRTTTMRPVSICPTQPRCRCSIFSTRTRLVRHHHHHLVSCHQLIHPTRHWLMNTSRRNVTQNWRFCCTRGTTCMTARRAIERWRRCDSRPNLHHNTWWHPAQELVASLVQRCHALPPPAPTVDRSDSVRLQIRPFVATGAGLNARRRSQKGRRI